MLAHLRSRKRATDLNLMFGRDSFVATIQNLTSITQCLRDSMISLRSRFVSLALLLATYPASDAQTPASNRITEAIDRADS